MVSAAAGGALITLAPLSATRQFTWPWVLLLAAVWLVPVATTLGSFVLRPSWQRPNGLLSAGLILLAISTVAAAALSPFASLSLLRIWPTLAGVSLYFWVHDWLAGAGEVRAGRLAAGLTWFGAILAVVSLAGWYWQAAFGSGLTRNTVPFGHSTYTAGAMVLILPWLVYGAGRNRGWRRAGWALTAATGFGALLATSSRGGVLAAGAVCAIAAGIVVFRAGWTRRTKALAVVIAAGVLAFAIVSNPRLRELVRGGGWGDSARESNAQRSAMLEAGGRLGAQRPVTGWGPGTVPLVYPQVRGQLNGGVDNVLQLHNTPAQLWATLGGGGILALLLLVTATVRRVGKLVRQASFSPLAVTAAASVVGYGLFVLTDHQLDLPAMNALLVLNLALLFRNEQPSAVVEFARWPRRVAVLTVGAILAAPLLLTGRDLLARSAYDQSLTLFEHGRETRGLERLGAAARWAPADPYYRHQLAGRLLTQRANTKDPTARARLTAEVVDQLKASLAAGCLQEFAHFSLGWLALENAEPAAAAQHFLAAAREAPHRGGVYFGLGLALRGTGQEAAAVRAFALEWLDDPLAATAPVWEWPDFAPLRPQVAREADALLAGLATAHPAATYVRDLWHWWSHEAPPPVHGFNVETEIFVEALGALSRHQPPPAAAAPYIWGRLLEAWPLSSGNVTMGSLVPRDPGFAAALVRRAARHPPPDWAGFLTSGLENEPLLLLSLQSERTGYGVLALHPDGPVLTDLYVKQQNRFVSTFASTLFPSKGWIPARELLARLPALP
jgi:tetratricopeptide (TPR) repeat protein